MPITDKNQINFKIKTMNMNLNKQTYESQNNAIWRWQEIAP